MPDFHYTAREMSGQEVTGVLTAANEQEVVNTLSVRSLFPTKISPAQPMAAQQRMARRRVKGRDLSIFYSQMADLLRSGVPLLRSLEILGNQSSLPTMKLILEEVRDEVADGSRLADAMQRHPRVFRELAVSMVRAGEEGGFLEDVLQRIATFTDHQEDLQSRVIGAMAYPAFLLVACIVVVTGMLVFLVPNFAPIFERLEARGELPWPTHALLGLSAFLKTFGLWLALGLAAGGWALMRYLATEDGRLRLDTWRLKLKGLGPIVRNLAVARFCRVLGTLLHNGVPILPSLRIAKDATGNRLLSAAISSAADNISSGKSLARPLAASGQFSMEVVEMIAVGEEANNLEQVLINIAEALERRTYRQLELFVRLLEPILLMIMALVIVMLMIALLMPVFQGAGALG
jgi:general secretion pathway protein F/type IV pilus assembly protein PilC